MIKHSIHVVSQRSSMICPRVSTTSTLIQSKYVNNLEGLDFEGFVFF